VEEALELLIEHLDQEAGSRHTLVLDLLDDFDRRTTAADRRLLTTGDLYDETGLPA